MLTRLDEAGSRVFLLGGTGEEVRGARERIEARFPGLHVVGAHHGYFDASGEESETVIRAVNEVQPEVLLVAMGVPRQEQWIAANLSRLQVNVAVAEGGSFSFISGATRRAPRWLRRLGLEWLYRLARQPWRLRRQLAIPQFVWLVVRERLRAGRGG
jgi:N-acetylglucosaminyldiphosphoundecaprenol N-acetyl-beta-D-mannosaminyltransferase